MVEMPIVQETETEKNPTPSSDANNVTLNEILNATRKLPAYDKLLLIRMLADELAKQINELLSIPPGIYESFTPYEINGIAEDLVAKLNAAPPPRANQHAT